MSPFLIFFALTAFGLGGVLFSLWKGAAAERIAACVVVANLVFAFALSGISPVLAGTLGFASDGLSAVILLVVTVRYGAPWMGGIMLLYAAQFSLHSFYLVTGRSNADFLHALINNVIFAGIIWCLIIGTIVTVRRRARFARQSQTRAPS
jgi:hypothetical protein